MGGNREGERRLGWSMTPTITPQQIIEAAVRPSWSTSFLLRQRVAARMLQEETRAKDAADAARIQSKLMPSDLDWGDLAWMRENWDRPLFVKAILHPDDASRAVDPGACC